MFPQSLTSILYSPCKRTRNLSTNFLDVTFDLTHRTRNVLWYNPPYSKNASTNIARTFLQLLIDKQFSPTSKLHELFNQHTVRVSYSCSENTKSFISTHSKTILRRQRTRPENRKDKHELYTKLQLLTY